jgi:DNA-binding LytR/AlgR family response regulator
MKVIIIEDELYNYRLLKGMIDDLRPDWEIQGHFESVTKSVDWLQSNPHPDLIFLDIQLSDGICFSIFEQIEVLSSVIFTTAYDQYAVQAFKVNSVDYLLKPIKKDELEIGIKKYERVLKQSNEKPVVANYEELLNALHKDRKYRKRFLISGATALFKLAIEDIAYFYTESRVTFAVTFDNKEHIIDQNLEKLEEELNPESFFRANRSMIIHIDSIEKIESYFGGKLHVQMIQALNKELTISRLKASAFKEWVDN